MKLRTLHLRKKRALRKAILATRQKDEERRAAGFFYWLDYYVRNPTQEMLDFEALIRAKFPQFYSA